MQKNDGAKESVENVAEKIFEMCKKFVEKTDGKIVLSHDCDSVSTAIAAICAGAIAISGKRCMYFKNQPLFATRSAVKTYFASGGIHIYLNETDSLCVVFMDENGYNADFCSGKEVFSAGLSALGIIPINGYKYHYMRRIAAEYENLNLKYKILIYAKSHAVRDMMNLLFSVLECEVSFFSAENGENFVSTIKNGLYDAGIYIGENGETAVLTDENGKKVTREDIEKVYENAENNRLFMKNKDCDEDDVGTIINLLAKIKNSGKTVGEFINQYHFQNV